MNETIKPGQVVRFRWRRRSGRWLVIRTDHPSWDDALLVRCVVAPRGRDHAWTVGSQGWVRALFEIAPSGPGERA